MTLTRTHPPSATPITLDDLRTHLRIDGSDLDSMLGLLAGAVTAEAEARCRRAWMAQGWVQVEPAPCARIDLARWPVLSVLGVRDGRGDLVAGTDYIIRVGDAGSVEVVGGWCGEVTIEYRAGYAEPDPGASDPDADAARCREAVPAAVRWWLLDRCRERHDGSAVADGALLDPYVVYRT